MTTRLIKRYNNRKLYDTTDSCYVTLQEISNIIKKGENVQVVDNSTKKDLTYTTLLNCIFNNEVANGNESKLELLVETLRSETGTFSDKLSSNTGFKTNEA